MMQEKNSMTEVLEIVDKFWKVVEENTGLAFCRFEFFQKAIKYAEFSCDLELAKETLESFKQEVSLRKQVCIKLQKIFEQE